MYEPSISKKRQPPVFLVEFSRQSSDDLSIEMRKLPHEVTVGF
jgi:hypothetical protein